MTQQFKFGDRVRCKQTGAERISENAIHPRPMLLQPHDVV